MDKMKSMTSIAALAVFSIAFPVCGTTAEGAWIANHACNVTSPDRGDAPRVTLNGSRKGEIGGKITDAARFRLYNIPRLSEEERTVFADTVVEIPGFATWTGIDASGRQEESAYALYLPLPSLAAAMGPIEAGRSLKITVQTKEGSRTFEIDLTGSAKAIASFRDCAT